MRHIGQLITDTIDFEQSALQHRTAVRQGVDADLDEIKRTYDGMDSLLTKVMDALLREIPEWAQKYIANCIFFPQIGFLTVVPLDLASGTGHYEGEGVEEDIWEQKFTSEEMGYYKNRRMRQLDVSFGDLYGTICGQSVELLDAPLILHRP